MIMSKKNGSTVTREEAVTLVELVEVEAVVAAVEVPEPVVLTIVRPEPVLAPRKLSLDERIQKVEDLSLLIDRYRILNESRRKLQTFQLGADGLSSSIQLRDAAGNEFRTSNSAVINTVIDEMKRTLDTKVREVEDLIYGKQMIMQSNPHKTSCISSKHNLTLHKYFA